MSASIYISICAILIALCSLAWSIHVGLRDRGNVKASCELTYYMDSDKPDLEVKAINSGRRPAILMMFGADFQGGSWMATHLKQSEGRLGENEIFRKTISAGGSDIMSPEGEEAVDLWFEDTLGRRYRVKNAKENLKELWGKSKA